MALVLVVGVSACSSATPTDTPPAGTTPVDSAVQALVKGLQTGDLKPVTTDAAALADYATIMGGMDGMRPTATVKQVKYLASEKTATATLAQKFLVGTGDISFDSTATFAWTGSAWQLKWAPTVVHPQLTEQTRLRHTRDVPARAEIIGANGVALVSNQPVYRIGINKQGVTAAQAQADAAKLAALLKINSANYVKQVAAAGDSAFVVALVVRKDALPTGVDAIKSALAMADTQMLPLSRTFASSLLGSLGSPTTKQVSDSHGAIVASDQVGVGGLQARYDAQLRGTVGQTVEIVPRASASASRSASASPNSSTDASTDPTASPSDSPSASPSPQVLFTSAAVPGKPLQLTLDADKQLQAEKALASQSGIASIVVLDRNTGGILAAANSTASGGNSYATTGQYPPGSTFKVVSSLALLRKGLTPTSTVACPATITVDGRSFKNYSDYPSSKLGNITFTDALANSCNTAFLGQASKISAADLTEAAASLGVGHDYSSGFASYYGKVPPTTDAVTHAADMIGQGQVTASPMAMAAVAASVGAGKTIIPNLVVGQVPTASGKPLTAAEAASLQTMMKAVVSDGSGKVLANLATGAKTGTAEYGTATPPKTHGWMIAYTGTEAIAAMVYDGASGSSTAGPVISAYLK